MLGDDAFSIAAWRCRRYWYKVINYFSFWYNAASSQALRRLQMKPRLATGASNALSATFTIILRSPAYICISTRKIDNSADFIIGTRHRPLKYSAIVIWSKWPSLLDFAQADASDRYFMRSYGQPGQYSRRVAGAKSLLSMMIEYLR